VTCVFSFAGNQDTTIQLRGSWILRSLLAQPQAVLRIPKHLVFAFLLEHES
jgi:hypothetical protein